MKLSRIAAGAAVLLSAALASGCASMQSEPRELDTAYMAYVEHAAKRYSTQVIWVNLPTRPVAQAPAERTEQPAK